MGGVGLGSYRLGDSFEKVKAAIGMPKDASRAQADPNSGMVFYPEKGLAFLLSKDLKILGITVTDPSLSTPESIRVGSSLSQVQSAYGKGISRGSKNRAYPDKGLAFSFTDGAVTHIFIVQKDVQDDLVGDAQIVPGQRMGELRLGMATGKIVSSWSQPKEKKAIKGGHQLWTFPSRGLSFVIKADKVEGIIATTGDYITAEGVKMDSTRDQVVKSFGAADKETEKALYYSTRGLTFMLEQGQVIEIQIYRPYKPRQPSS